VSARIVVSWEVPREVRSLLDLLECVRTGVLTTEHAASSHGLPVVVDDESGVALGPAEVTRLAADLYDGGGTFRAATPEQIALWARASEAGYNVAPLPQPLPSLWPEVTP
jgi:hypothetical protein